MLNPFTPGSIVSKSEDFAGRRNELKNIRRDLKLGSVAIDGAIGIGKSSLMARIKDELLALSGKTKYYVAIAVGTKDCKTIDDLAKTILNKFVRFTGTSKRTITIGIPKVLSYSSADTSELYKEGRYLDTLLNIISERFSTSDNFLVIAIDESDKCPSVVAKLVRAVVTNVQLDGIDNVRFMLAGVSPYFDAIVEEDSGVRRLFKRKITLRPMSILEAKLLLKLKFSLIIDSLKNLPDELDVDPKLAEMTAQISGGHPHLIQLLGSHIIEHEIEEPDGVLDALDLSRSFKEICEVERGEVYRKMLDELESESNLQNFRDVLSLAKPNKMPTKVDREQAILTIGEESLKWLISRNYIREVSSTKIGLVDELFRVFLILIEEGSSAVGTFERKQLKSKSTIEDDDDEDYVME